MHDIYTINIYLYIIYNIYNTPINIANYNSMNIKLLFKKKCLN